MEIKNFYKIDFSIGESEVPTAEASEEKKNSTWYIQRIIIPVNEDGKVDQREEKIYCMCVT